MIHQDEDKPDQVAEVDTSAIFDELGKTNEGDVVIVLHAQATILRICCDRWTATGSISNKKSTAIYKLADALDAISEQAEISG